MSAPETARAGRPPVLARLLRQRLAVTALVLLVLLALAAVAAPWLVPYAPDDTDLDNVLALPGSAHLLGTDDLGRDVLSRLLYGSRVSLLAALQATAFAVVLGVPFGLLAGYYGRWIDVTLSRISDALMTFPALLLAVIIVGLTGPGLTNAMLAVGVVYAPRLFRIARSSVVAVLPETYVLAARSIGCSGPSILGRHVLRNVLSPLFVQVSLTAGTAILAEASLSFLGLGVQPPTASWGTLLGRSVAFMSVQPVAVIATGLLIALVVLSCNLLGDGVRDSIGRERRG